jgi:hypothetical protein
MAPAVESVYTARTVEPHAEPGAPLVAGRLFAMSTPPGPPSPTAVAPPPDRLPRPAAVTLLALASVLGGLASMALGPVAGFAPLVTRTLYDRYVSSSVMAPLGLFLMSVLVSCGAIAVITAFGLWRLRPWARTCLILLSAIGLLNVPLGTILSAGTLYYLTRPGTRLLFSGRAPATFSEAERGLIARGSGQSLVVATVLLTVLGNVALIGYGVMTVRTELRRMQMLHNESLASLPLHRMIQAQVAWWELHGEYAELRCLARAESCSRVAIPGPELPPAITSLEPRDGYRFAFRLRRGSYAYWAVPLEQDVSGRHTFCADHTGAVRLYPMARGWVEPAGDAARCPDGGLVLSRPAPSADSVSGS